MGQAEHPQTTQVESGTYKEPVLADIKKEWCWVKDGLLEVLEDNPNLTWTPEDVYAQCVYGDAFLFVADEGFVVATIHTDEFTKEKAFFVWIAWAAERGNKNVMKYLPFFEEVAKKTAGCTTIEVWTKVDKMEVYLGSLGWDLIARVYRKQLNGSKGPKKRGLQT